MAQVVADEHRVSYAGEDAARRVVEAVELDAPEPGNLAPPLVAPSQRRGVESSTPAVADDVVLVPDELVS